VPRSAKLPGVTSLLDEFLASRPHAVLVRGGETFIDATAAVDLVALAAERGVRVLGREGFLITDDAVYPALSRIADFSSAIPQESARLAHNLLTGDWAEPPRSADQLHSEAAGRHMVAVVLGDS
jgi:hypothetical protein